MGEFAAWLRGFALALGAPGLFLVALLDSSFLSLPEIADLLVVWMVTHHRERMLVYVAAATAGSLGGCSLLYTLGRKGGEALVRRRFATVQVERAMKAVQRHGALAVLVPAILPPPMPFKIFVLLAGAAQITAMTFFTAVAVGRGARFLVLGFLAVRYGDRALLYLEEHALPITLTFIGLLAVSTIAYLAWTRTRRARNA